MKIAALFICANDRVESAVSLKRERLIPESVRKEWAPAQISVVPMVPIPGVQEESFLNNVENVSDKFEGLVVFIPKALSYLLNRSRRGLFVFEYDGGRVVGNLQNQLSGIIRRGFTAFRQLLGKARRKDNLRAILLPLDDFIATPVQKLRELFENISDRPHFARELDQILSDLRSYQSPKRVSEEEVRVVYTDDRGKVFEVARERHAEAEVSVPPHDVVCGLNKACRFGVKYDEKFHYNVTIGGDVRRHRFAGCHLNAPRINRATHANLFPNGYVT